MSTKPAKRKRTLLYVLLGVFALLIGAAVMKARSAKKGEEVTVEKPQRRTIRETVSASGKVFPETEVKISSDVSGEVIELYIKEGDSVTIGQVLAKIRPDEYVNAVERAKAAVGSAKSQRDVALSNVQSSGAQVKQAKAELTRVEAQYEDARLRHQRNEQLRKEGVISQLDFETTLGTLRVAEIALVSAKEGIQLAQSNYESVQKQVNTNEYQIKSADATSKEAGVSLQKTIIIAPVSGIVSKLSIEKGERVVGTLQMAGTEMMRIANLGSMETQVDVSETDILKVALNDEVEVEVDAYLGRKFTGRVTEIANSASNLTGNVLNTDQVTNFIVKIRIDPTSYTDLVSRAKPYPFRPGMSAAVDIFTNTADQVLCVPIIAVTVREEDKEKIETKDDKGPGGVPKKVDQKIGITKEIVYVVVGDTVGIKEVKTGIQDNDYIEIKDGLADGETIVTGPYSAIARKLKSGARIEVVDKDAKDKKKKKKEK